MSIPAKSLSSYELAKIEQEWSDSNAVCSLLGHINYLTDAIVLLVGQKEDDESLPAEKGARL